MCAREPTIVAGSPPCHPLGAVLAAGPRTDLGCTSGPARTTDTSSAAGSARVSSGSSGPAAAQPSYVSARQDGVLAEPFRGDGSVASAVIGHRATLAATGSDVTETRAGPAQRVRSTAQAR